MSYTKLLANIDDAARNSMISKINQLHTDMPFLVLITKKEKSKGLRLGNKTGTFFEKSAMLSSSNVNILTPSFSLSEFVTRINDWKALKDIKTQINKMNDAVNCTAIAYEQQIMSECLYFYGLAQGAASQNIPGASAIVSELESMMPRKGKKVRTIEKRKVLS